MKEKILRQTIRQMLLREVTLSISGGSSGSGTAEVSSAAGNQVDLMTEAMREVKRSAYDVDAVITENLQNLIQLNDIIWGILQESGNKSAWETLAEKLLGNDWLGNWKPATGSSAVQEAAGQTQTVTTFYDVVGGEDGKTYASVKSSFKPSAGSYRSAASSSSVKIQSILAFLIDEGLAKGASLGNIGVYADRGEETTTIHWGHITTPIAAEAVLDLIRDELAAMDEANGPLTEGAEIDIPPGAPEPEISPDEAAAENVRTRVSVLDELLNTPVQEIPSKPTKSGRPRTAEPKMSKAGGVDRQKNMDLIVSFFQAGGHATKDGRMGITKGMSWVLGPMGEGVPIGSLTVHKPEILFERVIKPATAHRTGVNRAKPEERNIALRKLQTMARAMSAEELATMVKGAQEAMGIIVEANIRRVTRRILINSAAQEVKVKTTRRQLRRIIKEVQRLPDQAGPPLYDYAQRFEDALNGWLTKRVTLKYVKGTTYLIKRVPAASVPEVKEEIQEFGARFEYELGSGTTRDIGVSFGG
jgi:hypothetical protein